MINWLEKLHCVLEDESAVILVTVIAVRGSAPREIGAKLLISDTRQWGTVGGGNLEYQAIALAKDMMRLLKSGRRAGPEIQSFALGPTLGQCCGGHVELMFESIDSDTDWFRHAVKLTKAQSGKRYWMCRSLSELSSYHFVEGAQIDTTSPLSARQLAGATAKMLDDESALPFTSCVMKSVEIIDSGPKPEPTGWWCEMLDPELPEVWVFGAGHVGRALQEQLQLLPCRTVAIDSRDDLLQQLSPSVRVISSDGYASEVEFAPAGVWFIVMTHSHALDFDICYAVLQRKDFAFLGLIGSTTKRATFASRLAHRGIEAKQISRLVSPIGRATIQSRLPQFIALGVAAELAEQWQGSFVQAD